MTARVSQIFIAMIPIAVMIINIGDIRDNINIVI